MLLDKLAQTFVAEELAFTVVRFGDAVGVKHQDVATFESDTPLVVRDIFENSQRESRQLDAITTAIFVKHGLRLAGIGDAEFLAAFLPNGETRGHESPFDTAFADQLVHLAQHFGRLKLLRGKAPHDANGYGTVEGGRSSLPADVAQRDAELLRAIPQKIIQVPANFAS